ncbi:MAG: class I SAM-dependent methyltransferase, partial [Proteobacteria bacterium]|nr:class I SAM-dependent methyltransferase [Pseudomonadota bacterium]
MLDTENNILTRGVTLVFSTLSNFFRSIRSGSRQRFLSILPRHAVCAEIGVFRGDFSEHILKITRPKEAHFIDSWWVEYGENFPDWGDYTNFGTLKTRDAHYEAKTKIDRYRTNSTIHVERDLDCISKFENQHFDWVYMDSNHTFEHTLELLAI